MAIDNKTLLGLEETTKKPSPPKSDNIEDDFAYARSTIYNLADKNSEALELMMELARESEHPRAFEVLTGMIKQNADLAEQLMVLSQRKQKLDEPTNTQKNDESKQITNNNVFVGTTEELQRLLLDSDDGDVIDHDQ